MDTQTNETVRLFFSSEKNTETKSPSKEILAYILMFGGVLASFLSINSYNGDYFFFGIASFIVGLLLTGKKLNTLFSSSEDENAEDGDMAQQLIKDTERHILPKISAVSNINTAFVPKNNIYIFRVPVYEQIPLIEKEKILRKEMDENHFAYAIWNIHIFIVSQSMLIYFSCTYDWPNNTILNEHSNEYYYTDISSIKTEFADKTFWYKDKDETTKENVKMFVVSNISGDKIEFVAERPGLAVAPAMQHNTNDILKSMRRIINESRFPKETSYKTQDIDFEIEYPDNVD